MTKGPVRILHLSDFHFTAKTGWDYGPLFKALPEAVKELVRDGLAPDLVAITGDVAFSGKKADYELAGTWIEESLLPALPAGFSNTHILLVRLYDLKERLWRSFDAFVNQHLSLLVEDADIHRSCMKIYSAVVLMLVGVEAHSGLLL